MPRRVLILGAAGRDFHNFNVVFRDDPAVVVVAFTAAQTPGIAGRRYPPVLAGPRYPAGIPIEDESALEDLCRRERVDTVVFAYSDVTQRRVMELATVALGCGADFTLLGPDRTMLPAAAPVVAISAVLFTIGVAGVLFRRNAIVIFMCVELMLNAVNLTFVALAQQLGVGGQVFVFFVMAVAAAEAAVGLAIILAVYRHKQSVSLQNMNLLKDG